MSTKQIKVSQEEVCHALRKAMTKAGFVDAAFLDLIVNDDDLYQAAWADEGGWGVRGPNEQLVERAAKWIAKYLEKKGVRHMTFSYAGGLRDDPPGYIQVRKMIPTTVQTCVGSEVILHHYFVKTSWMSIGD